MDPIFGKIVTEVLSPLYQAAVACAFVYFLYGVVQFIYNYNNPSEKNVGKSHLLWGTLGLFIIFTIGGILRFFADVFKGMFSF